MQRLPVDVLKRYEKWKDIVKISGPTGLRAIKGFTMNPSKASGRDIARHDLVSSIDSYIGLLPRNSWLPVIDIPAHDNRKR